MKQIKVDCCGNCPFLKYYTSLSYMAYCNNCGTEELEIKNKNIIHPYCKLEDIEKESKK